MPRTLAVLLAAVLTTASASRLSAQQPAASTAARDSVAQLLDSARARGSGALPSADRFAWGDLTIPADATVDGPVAVARGTVNVRGRVHGDVFAVFGDIIVHPSGDVTGSTLALRGKVIVNGGHVGGEMRSVAAPTVPAAAAAPRSDGESVRHALAVTAGWYVVVLLVGLGVILFSGAQLEGVVQALEHRFGPAFFLGIAAQVGIIPLLVLLCLALALTIVGVLLIPFAIVAYILGVAGLVSLGALAAASVAGHAVVRTHMNVRVRAVQSLMVGTSLLALPWVASALLVNSAWGELLARIAAIAITWVAATAGLGAALMARGGVRRVDVRTARVEVSPDSWQTPTPIGGVIAVRRPTPTPSSPPNVER